MAKTSVVEREKKREELVHGKQGKLRLETKAKLKVLYGRLDTEKDKHEQIFAEIEVLQIKLDKMPRNSSQIRLRNRCRITGRPRGVYRKFRLCRNMLRKYAMMGLVPGLRKSSW